MPGLRRTREKPVFDLELPEDATIRTMLQKLGFKEGEIEYLRTYVNNQLERLEKNLKEGDDVWIGAVIGGG